MPAAEARPTHASSKKQVTRPGSELLLDLQVHQIELEMQNDELRKSHALMEQMRDRYVDLYEFASVGYLTLDRSGMITDTNLTGTALFGVERKKLVHCRFSSFISPESKVLWDRHFLTMLQRDGRQNCELELQRPDGSRLHALITSLKSSDFLSSVNPDDPLSQDDPLNAATSLRIVITDITERKHAEEAIAKAEEKFHLLFDSIADAIFITGMDGRFIQVNQSACELLGYSHDELIKMGPADVDSHEYAEKAAERVQILAQQGKLVCESAQVRKDGVVIPVELNARIISIGDNSAILAVARDLTVRKQAEKHLHDLTAYVQAVREEEKASIAREIHDDLGGTLLILKIGTHQLKDKLSAHEDAEPLLDQVEEMSQAIDRAADIMRDIITGLRPPILIEIGLLAALEWQAMHFQNHTGINCRVNCVGDKGNLDKSRSIELFRISQEALSNVARHSRASCVEFEYLHSDNEVVMSIIDNGHGMPVTHTDTTRHFGLLGMRERVGHLGGRINFGTPPGGGFNVTVILPLPADEKEKK